MRAVFAREAETAQVFHCEDLGAAPSVPSRNQHRNFCANPEIPVWICTRIQINTHLWLLLLWGFIFLTLGVWYFFFRLHRSTAEEPHILLECDSSVLDSIQQHLKLYKIRRKVTISPCPDLSLWAVIPGDTSSLPKCADQALLLTPDPRAEVMGWRLIAKKGADLSEIIPGSQVGDVQDYHRHRYKQGKAKAWFALWVLGVHMLI